MKNFPKRRYKFPKVADCCHVDSLMKLQFQRGNEISLTLQLQASCSFQRARPIVMLNPIGQKEKRMPKATHSRVKLDIEWHITNEITGCLVELLSLFHSRTQHRFPTSNPHVPTVLSFVQIYFSRANVIPHQRSYAHLSSPPSFFINAISIKWRGRNKERPFFFSVSFIILC